MTGMPPGRYAMFARLVLVFAPVLIVAPFVLADDAPPPAPPKDTAELQAIEKKVREVRAKVLPATVGVQIGNSRGSGVIVSEDGMVLTAGHVVGKPGQDVTFYFSDGTTAKGKTLGLYKNADAGLMKITDEGKRPFVEMGTSAEMKVGDWCVAMGHPMGYQKERPAPLRVGRVLKSEPLTIQTDCPLVGGDSGGPLFDLEGRVIGINSRIGPMMTMNFHAPVDVFKTHWHRLAKGEQWEDKAPSRDSGPVKLAFRQSVGAASAAVVRVKCDGKDSVLGTIVGPDGWIATKASEMRGKIVCKTRDDKEHPARVVGIDPRFDLAMLKVESRNMPAIGWTVKQPEVGQWVAAVGPGEDPLAVGVVSVPRRAIPHTPGVLGIHLEDSQTGAKINKIVPNSPAQKADLKENDVITHVNGTATPDREQLVTFVRKHRIGTTLKLTVKRGEETLEISATLGKVEDDGTKKRDMQNRMGVGVSGRRDAFPVVLQHDTALRPADCGGPLVDLSGKVVGVNIARGGRTETYCVPTDVMVNLMYDLMAGRLKNDGIRKAEDEAEKARLAAAKAAADKAAATEAARAKAEEMQKLAEEQLAAEKTAREKAEAESTASLERATAEQAARAKIEADAAAARDKAAADLKAVQDQTAAKEQQLMAETATLQAQIAQLQQQLAAEEAARENVEAQLKQLQPPPPEEPKPQEPAPEPPAPEPPTPEPPTPEPPTPEPPAEQSEPQQAA